MWLSKYALSDGIKEVTARLSRADSNYAIVEGLFGGYLIGRDIHETKEGAVAAAEAMRVKKIASLEKQIEKLRKLTF